MRAIVESQLPLASPWIDHPHADELCEMDQLLLEHRNWPRWSTVTWSQVAPQGGVVAGSVATKLSASS